MVAPFEHPRKQPELLLRDVRVLGDFRPVDHALNGVKLVHDVDEDEVLSVTSQRLDSSYIRAELLNDFTSGPWRRGQQEHTV